MNLARRGFSLPEMMVVVVIVGLLATASGVKYTYTVEQSKVGMATGMLQKMREAQNMSLLTFGKFATNQTKLPIKNWAGFEAYNFTTDGKYVVATRNNPNAMVGHYELAIDLNDPGAAVQCFGEGCKRMGYDPVNKRAWVSGGSAGSGGTGSAATSSSGESGSSGKSSDASGSAAEAAASDSSGSGVVDKVLDAIASVLGDNKANPTVAAAPTTLTTTTETKVTTVAKAEAPAAVAAVPVVSVKKEPVVVRDYKAEVYNIRQAFDAQLKERVYALDSLIMKYNEVNAVVKKMSGDSTYAQVMKAYEEFKGYYTQAADLIAQENSKCSGASVSKEAAVEQLQEAKKVSVSKMRDGVMSYEDQMAQYQREYSTLQADYENAKSRGDSVTLAAISEKMASLQKNMDALTSGRLTTLQEQRAKLVSSAAELQAKYDAAYKPISDLEAKRVSLDTAISDAKAGREAFRTTDPKFLDLVATSKKLSAEIESLDKSIAEAQAKGDNSTVAMLTEKRDSYQSNLESVSNSMVSMLAEYDKKIATLQKEQDTLVSKIDTALIELDPLKSEMDALKSQIAKIDSEITALKGEDSSHPEYCALVVELGKAFAAYRADPSDANYVNLKGLVIKAGDYNLGAKFKDLMISMNSRASALAKYPDVKRAVDALDEVKAQYDTALKNLTGYIDSAMSGLYSAADGWLGSTNRFSTLPENDSAVKEIADKYQYYSDRIAELKAKIESIPVYDEKAIVSLKASIDSAVKNIDSYKATLSSLAGEETKYQEVTVMADKSAANIASYQQKLATLEASGDYKAAEEVKAMISKETAVYNDYQATLTKLAEVDAKYQSTSALLAETEKNISSYKDQISQMEAAKGSAEELAKLNEELQYSAANQAAVKDDLAKRITSLVAPEYRDIREYLVNNALEMMKLMDAMIVKNIATAVQNSGWSIVKAGDSLVARISEDPYVSDAIAAAQQRAEAKIASEQDVIGKIPLQEKSSALESANKLASQESLMLQKSMK